MVADSTLSPASTQGRRRAGGRVLLVTHAFPPDSHAGVEVYTSRLAQELQGRGRAVAVCTARLRPGGAQYALEEGEVDRIPAFGIVQNWPYRGLPEAVDDPAVDRVFAAVFDRFRPDLVAVQTLAGLSLGVLRHAAARVPTVVHLHDGWWSCPSGGQRRHPDGSLCLPVDRARCGDCFARFQGLEGPVEAWSRRAAGRLPSWVPPDALHRAWNRLPSPVQGAVRRVNERRSERAPAPVDLRGAIDDRARRVREAFEAIPLVISPTSFLAESLAADGVAGRRTEVVPTGVPRPERAPPSVGGRPLRVLFLGTWVDHKGPGVLADALARLDPADAASLTATAHGPTPFPDVHRDVLDRAAGRLIDGGVLQPDAVPDAIDAADVVVVPSTWAENAPLVALEARARGRVVVASRIGGLPELVSEASGGILVPPGDAAALADVLARLVRDPAEVADRAARSRATPPRGVPEWVDAVTAAWDTL